MAGAFSTITTVGKGGWVFLALAGGIGCGGAGMGAAVDAGAGDVASPDSGGESAVDSSIDGDGVARADALPVGDATGDSPSGWDAIGESAADSTADRAADSAPDAPAEAGADAGQPCTNDTDCTTGGIFLFCTPGGTQAGCGVCLMPQRSCNTDVECEANPDAAQQAPMVCAPTTGCICPVPGKSGACLPACQSSSDCTVDEACQAGHCVAKPCTADTDCPTSGTPIYGCASHACGVKSCTTDADCGSAGYCVDKTCSSLPGLCAPGAA